MRGLHLVERVVRIDRICPWKGEERGKGLGSRYKAVALDVGRGSVSDLGRKPPATSTRHNSQLTIF